MDIRLFLEMPGRPGQVDPTGQLFKVGWLMCAFKAAVIELHKVVWLMCVHSNTALHYYWAKGFWLLQCMSCCIVGVA